MTQHKVPASVAKQSVVDVLVLCGPPLVAVGLLALLASKQPESWEVVFVLAVGLRCFLGASVSFAGGRLAAKLLRIGFSGSWLIGATVGYCASLLFVKGLERPVQHGRYVIPPFLSCGGVALVACAWTPCAGRRVPRFRHRGPMNVTRSKGTSWRDVCDAGRSLFPKEAAVKQRIGTDNAPRKRTGDPCRSMRCWPGRAA
jgi:hypothetical protein